MKFPRTGSAGKSVLSNRASTLKSLLVLLPLLFGSVAFNSNAQTSTNILPGQTLSDGIISTEQDVFSFTGASNETIVILMVESVNNTYFSPRIELMGPGGTAVTNIQGSSAAFLDGFKLPTNGTYQIVCRDGQHSLGGDYSVTLVKIPGPNLADSGETNSMAAGQTRTGNIGLTADIDVLEYVATAGKRVTIQMSESPGATFFNPYFDIRAADGTRVASATGGAVARLDSFLFTNSGTYYILCRDAAGQSTSSYAITLIENTGPNAADNGETNSIASGQVRSGSIGLSDIDAYEIFALVGESLSVAMTKTSGAIFSPHFDLWAPDGTLMTGAEGASSATKQFDCLPQSGTYLVLCRDAACQNTGNYDLSVVKSGWPALSTNLPPKLQVLGYSNVAMVRWTTNAADFRLEYSTNILPPLTWSNIAGPYPQSQDFFYKSQGLPPNAVFFRLAKP